MTIVFRVDASILIGTGHVMRCLTLANCFNTLGYSCTFICRSHKGHLGDLILSEGHQLRLLANNERDANDMCLAPWNNHSNWLGVHWSLDAQQSKEIVENLEPQWLIVDHYALDSFWEAEIRPLVKKIMVIDDLSDRNHDCDLLLDQTFNRQKQDYLEKVPSHCVLLCGAQYSLLRAEFSEWRETSLRHRESSGLNLILVNLGGVDKDDFTSRVLLGLRCCDLPKTTKIIVVMGRTAPWKSKVTSIASLMPWETEVKIDVSSMAELMAESDLAIGAAGATTWERCALGLPSIQVVIADNQRLIAKSLFAVGAVKILENFSELPYLIYSAEEWMPSISKNCRTITDGFGVNRVVPYLKEAL